MDYAAQFQKLVDQMTAEKNHAQAILDQVDVWARASIELGQSLKSIRDETAALNAAWDDPNGAKMLKVADSAATTIEGRREYLNSAAPWHKIMNAGNDIAPTLGFVQQQFEAAKPLIEQLKTADGLIDANVADENVFFARANVVSLIEAYLQAAKDRMKALGNLFTEATGAVQDAVQGNEWYLHRIEDPGGGPLSAPDPGVPEGGVPNGMSDVPQGGEATAPGGGAPPGGGGAPPGGGTGPSLSGQPSTPTLPSTGAPPPGGMGPGGLTPPGGGGPGIGPGLPPVIPPIGGTSGNGRVPAANLGGGARIPGVGLGGGGLGGGAGLGAASIAQAATPVGGPAQVAPSGPPPTLPPASLAGTSTPAGGVPMMPPMMPPMAGAGAGVGGGGGPGSGAARPAGAGRGHGPRNPTPGMPALLSGKAGKGSPHAIPPRPRLIQKTDAPATVELIDEDMWQVSERRTEESRPPARIHRH
ncbi:hypothetical protein GCM10022225_63500 [Plantactinospora mayteni]|uniref:Uncharacterized protein n=1 Tax=Plantactinospora mayteni TaxID=566021 RepID=A0ABQ4F074_9ACTN|nr:hypothetical protein [Plantactinospora mayteni]GIH00280.1 hypothetical protein Pma05_68520 [Plantactinospora mayteni]